MNFAIHFAWTDKLFGTFHLPDDRWPKDYGIPEDVPQGYGGQFLSPWTRTGKKLDESGGAAPAEKFSRACRIRLGIRVFLSEPRHSGGPMTETTHAIHAADQRG